MRGINYYVRMRWANGIGRGSIYHAHLCLKAPSVRGWWQLMMVTKSSSPPPVFLNSCQKNHIQTHTHYQSCKSACQTPPIPSSRVACRKEAMKSAWWGWGEVAEEVRCRVQKPARQYKKTLSCPPTHHIASACFLLSPKTSPPT